MKLRQITEEARPSETIRHTAESLGDMFDFIYKLDPKNKERQAVNQFLEDPTSQTWERAKWVVNSLIRQVVTNPELKARAEKWASINNVTSPIVASSIYDIDPKYTKGTPIDNISMSRNKRDDMKKTLGPAGYVSSLAGIGGEVENHDIKKYLKKTARDGEGLTTAAEKDMPDIVRKKQIRHF